MSLIDFTRHDRGAIPVLHFRGEFEASDPGGSRHVLLYWADDGGDLTLETADGTPITRIDKGHYHLARPHRVVELTCDDPDAP
jgi:hypothetical protein